MARSSADADQPVPVVVTNLVPEMAEERTVGLTQLLARLLAKRIIGLGDIDRDEPLVVAGENGLCGRAALEGKRQPMLLAG